MMSWVLSIFTWIKSLFVMGSSDPNKVVAIQAATIMACGFLPMAESIAALIATNPALAAAEAAASAICKVVTSKPMTVTTAGFGGSVQQAAWVLDGVPIQGKFIR